MSTIQKSIPHSDPFWVEHGYGTRFQGFQNLMRFRIRDILLVSSLYDLYVFEQDGRLYELLRDRYQGLNLTHSPELTRVSNGVEALRLAQDERRIDLIITTLHIEDMRPVDFARQLHKLKLDIPVVLLAFDNRELSDLLTRKESSIFDQVFIWQGDFQLLLAIIKYLEDRLNVEHDTHIAGVQSILVIEDNIRYYSSFLPLIYLEVMKQTQRLISEGINLSHKQLRRRARPKILHCKTYEQALDYFQKYEDTILGIISDIDFPRNGRPNPTAGLDFARLVLKQQPDIPVLLHSTVPENEEKAKEIGTSFLLKNSPTLMEDLRDFMITKLSFGDFVFRMPEGYEVGRASDLISLEKQIKVVPEECLRHHAERNHFSNWLKARTEFYLAYQLRPRQVSDFPTLEALRQDLISSLRDYRILRQRGIITEFAKESFDPHSSVSRIGGGSLGGKARGLSFVNILINNYNVQYRFANIRISVPPAVVIGTDVFDQFLAENDLRQFAMESVDDREIMRRFLEAKKFPEDVLAELAAFLDLEDSPLAVRSSSLLEDSHIHPFAGVYKTYMLPNCHSDPIARLSELVKAIKKVYASTFYRAAKSYIKATSYRLEEEKMAVIIQKMIGSRHSHRFYPVFSGVARSYNFYPISPQKSSDGVIAVSLGLGKMVVEGGIAVRFSPRYPKHIHQFSNVKEALKNTQNDFFALDLNEEVVDYTDTDDYFVKKYSLQHAEEDGTLLVVGSTYSHENNKI